MSDRSFQPIKILRQNFEWIHGHSLRRHMPVPKRFRYRQHREQRQAPPQRSALS